jgi:PAS domain S-box-containing protein
VKTRLAALPNAPWLIVDEGVVVDASESTHAIVGHGVIGKSVAEIFAAPLPELVFASTTFEDKRGRVFVVNARLFQDGGARITLTPRDATLASADVAATEGTLWSATSVLTHVVEHRDFVQAVLDRDPNLLAVKDRLGKYVFVNQSVATLLGTTAENVVRRSNAGSTSAVGPGLDDMDRAVLASGEEARFDEKVTLADGREVWLETRKHVLYAPDGETYIVEASVDITARRAVEERLRAEKERLELAAVAAGLGLWDWDVTTNEVFLSPAWKAQIGYRDDELQNDFKTWCSLMHPDEVDVLDSVSGYMGSPGSEHRYVNEFRLRSKDGSYRWIAGHGLVLRDKEGRPMRVTGYHVDITERVLRERREETLRQELVTRIDELKRLEEELRKSNADLARASTHKDQFLTTMSHELRTPMNAVLGQAEILLEGIYGPLDADKREAVETIMASGRHLLSLINDVLDVAKLDAGVLELALEPTALGAVCEEALRLVREQARRKEIKLSFTTVGAPVDVLADRRRLRQILLNLLSNAVKFTERGGTVELVVQALDARAQISVKDTGSGISKEEQDLLFRPFMQLDGGLNRKSEGTGLGLALVQKLTELHDGTVSVVSERNQGSTFRVELPLFQEPAPPRSESRSSVPTDMSTLRRLSLRRVLIVDDVPANVLHLCAWLRSERVQVDVAHDGAAALKLAGEADYDAMLIDIQMPGMDGLELIARLRKDPKNASCPVIALTALAMPGDEARCLVAGADEYVTKPTSVAVLATRLASAVDKRSVSRS